MGMMLINPNQTTWIWISLICSNAIHRMMQLHATFGFMVNFIIIIIAVLNIFLFATHSCHALCVSFIYFRNNNLTVVQIRILHKIVLRLQ